MKNFIFDVQLFSIDNYDDNSLVSGTSDSERIDNHGDNVTITGLGGSDTIWNRGSTVLAEGGADNDWLCAEIYTSNVTLQGDEGNDTLWAFSENNSMNGGAGNDFFYSGYGYVDGSLSSGSSGDNNTIIGGAGDDSISFSNGTSGAAKNNVIQYAKGDGNDSVFGFSSDDTLEITSGRFTTLKSGSDLIVKVGSEKITLKGAANIVTVGKNIKGLFVGKDISSSINNTILSGSSSADYIWNDGANVVMKGLSGNDTLGTKGNKVTINAGAGNDSIGLNNLAQNTKIYCDSGDDYVNGWGSNVTIYGGAGNDSMYLDPDYANKNIVHGGAGNDSICGAGKKSYIKGDAGADYVLLYTDSSNITVAGGADNDEIYCGGKKSYLKGDAGADYIHLYLESANTTVTGGAGNDTIKSYSTGKVTYVYNSGDGNDIIDGISANDTIKIGADSYTTVKSGSNIVVKVGTGKITLKNAVGTKFKIVGNSLAKGLKLNGTTLTATNSFTGSSINLTKYSNVKKFDGSAMVTAVKITGNSLSNSIIGGKKADTITGGAGNDTLTGNGGADLFIHTAGNDVITDYVSGTDKISVVGSYEGEISGSNVILTTNKGTLTIKNSADKTITINGETKNFSTDSDLPTGLSYGDDGFTLIVENSFTGGTIDLSKYSNVIDVDASNYRRMNLTITGNESNNSLVGGSGSDTIKGGAGNDFLTGNTGRDIFVHSAGDDTITDYTADVDKIRLKNIKIKNISVGANDVVFTTTKGTLTITNGAGKSITIIDSSGEHTQRYSANISEILADNSIGEFENYSEKVTQENLITYTK